MALTTSEISIKIVSVKVPFTLIVFEILLFEGWSVLLLVQQVAWVKKQMKANAGHSKKE